MAHATARRLRRFMAERKAIAEIVIDHQRGWVLPGFGSKPFTYQGWSHFEKDPTWGQKTWTLLVRLDRAPDLSADTFEATVWFFAPEAPHEVLEVGAKFELFMGQVHYTHGRITKILSDEPVPKKTYGLTGQALSK